MPVLGLTGLPVLPENQVGVVQRGRAAHVRPLLAVVGHVEGDSPLGGGKIWGGGGPFGVSPLPSTPFCPPYLPLGLVEDAVHGVEQRHGLVELQHQLLGQLGGGPRGGIFGVSQG